jgi:hypothetical protein
MQRFVYAALLALGLSSTAFTGQAQAACTQQRLTGKWSGYFTFVSGTTPFVGVCHFEMNTAGVIKKGGICDFHIHAQGEPSGRLTLHPSCVVTGQINVDDKEYQFRQATFGSGIVAGVIGSPIASFNLIKR